MLLILFRIEIFFNSYWYNWAYHLYSVIATIRKQRPDLCSDLSILSDPIPDEPPLNNMEGIDR